MASATVKIEHLSGNLACCIKKEMIIIGGGICGVIAAKMCHDRNISYILVERQEILGGNWHSLANAHSYLQAFEPNYRWDKKYRLSKDPLTKASAGCVLKELHRYADDHKIPENTLFRHEAVTITEEKSGTFRCVVKDLNKNETKILESEFLCVTPGILSTQFTAYDRGIKNLDNFRGTITLAGRHEGKDCDLSKANVEGKRIVILGSGSFAAEAMETADRLGAEHITIIGRPRYRWILPFSRQYTVSAIAQIPLIPWAWKYKFALWYLRKYYYEPCGLSHWIPKPGTKQMDYSGQCNDGYFRLSYQGKLTCRVDTIQSMGKDHVVLESGENIPCDVLVVASGCKYNLEPSFLKDLGLGFTDMHNYAFLGTNPRIGCASDFVFAYVPFGPIKQLEQFFHSVESCKEGLEEEMRAALHPTPLPTHGEGAFKGGRQAGFHTFFEYRNWWNLHSIAQGARIHAFLRTFDVGKSFWNRLAMRIFMSLDNTISWVGTCCLAIQEIYRFPVYGKDVIDLHHKPKSM